MRQVIETGTALDRKAYQIVVQLNSGPYSGDASNIDETNPGLRYATEVVRVLGSQYSYCYVGVPVNTFGDEIAPAVALQKDGPAGKVLLRSRAMVSMIDWNGNSIPLLNGYLIQYAHNLDEDSVVGMIMDDRWLLSKVTCFGAAMAEPRGEEGWVEWFDAGRHLIFNWDGYPDCVDAPRGPRFAPGRMYGYAKGDAVQQSMEPPAGQAKTMARSWRCQDIARYLRDMYYQSGLRPSDGADYGNQQISGYVNWPTSFGNQYGFNRVPRSFSLENLDMSEALSRLCKKAGPYEIQMNPVGWQGMLGIVQINSRRSGCLLTGPTYGAGDGGDIEDALSDPNRISGGSIIESIVGYFDDVCIAGDPPALEHEFATYGQDGTDTTTPIELENGWSTADEDAFKAIVEDNSSGGLGSQDAFAMAALAYPRVYACWKISKLYASYKKTWWPDIVPPFNPRILPRLLSGYSQDNENPRDWNPREIVLEYYDTLGYPAEWRGCARLDNLTIVDDGNAFMVTSLRDTQPNVTLHRVGWDPATYSTAQMRLTCAVERNFRITGKKDTDPNLTNRRVNTRGGEQFTFLTVAERGDYSHWERYYSRPNGNNCKEPYLSENFPDRCKADGSSGSWLFSDAMGNDNHEGGGNRLDRHALHRLEATKIIDYHGILSMHTWNPSLRPGLQVFLNAGGNSIVPYAVIRCVKFNSQTQSQQIELMAGDNSVIYDVPLPVGAQSAGGAPNKTGGTTAKTEPSTGESDPMEDMDKQYLKQTTAAEAEEPTSQSEAKKEAVPPAKKTEKKVREQNEAAKPKKELSKDTKGNSVEPPAQRARKDAGHASEAAKAKDDANVAKANSPASTKAAGKKASSDASAVKEATKDSTRKMGEGIFWGKENMRDWLHGGKRGID